MDSSNLEGSKFEKLPVCRLCLQISLEVVYSTKYLKTYMVSVLPYVDLNLSKDPQVCSKCAETLTMCYKFQIQCLNNQLKILQMYRVSNESVDLYNLVKETADDTEEPKKTCDNLHTSFKYTVETGEPRCVVEIDSNVVEIDSDDIASLYGDNEDDSDTEFVEEVDHKHLIKTETKTCFPDYVKTESCTVSEKCNLDEVDHNYFEHLDIKSTIIKEEPKQRSRYKSIEDHQKLNQKDSKSGDFSDLYDKTSDKTNFILPKKCKKICRKQFQCLLCNKKFAQKLTMDGHLLNKHKDFSDIECLIGSKIHHCKHCEYRTINTQNLTGHMRSKHGKKRKCNHELKTLFCSNCNYSTYNKGNLSIHMRKHSKVKLYSCQYCMHGFNQKSQLDNHYLKKHIKQNNET